MFSASMKCISVSNNFEHPNSIVGFFLHRLILFCCSDVREQEACLAQGLMAGETQTCCHWKTMESVAPIVWSQTCLLVSAVMCMKSPPAEKAKLKFFTTQSFMSIMANFCTANQAHSAPCLLGQFLISLVEKIILHFKSAPRQMNFLKLFVVFQVLSINKGMMHVERKLFLHCILTSKVAMAGGAAVIPGTAREKKWWSF